MFRILAYGATHVGRERKNNEDAFRISQEAGLYLVCDGMGGHASGEIASQIAADAMVRVVSQDVTRPDYTWPAQTPMGLPEEARLLDAAVRTANTEVFDAASANSLHKGMGTTVVGVLAGTQRLGLVHVGDSRIYRLRGGELTLLTDDHSLLNFYIQTRPMSADQIKQFAGKNVIVRAVGLREAVEPDVQVQDYVDGDVYLLCSDGVTDMVDEAVIAATLQDGGDKLAQTAERIIDHALAGGGKDNITVVLLRVTQLADEKRVRLAARATLPMDTGDFTDASAMEDTSPGFDLRGGDPSDAETLTEIEVQAASANFGARPHAKTQEVPYRPWQQSELNAPRKPAMPLPQVVQTPKRPTSDEFNVDTGAPTDPMGTRPADLLAQLAAQGRSVDPEAITDERPAFRLPKTGTAQQKIELATTQKQETPEGLPPFPSADPEPKPQARVVVTLEEEGEPVEVVLTDAVTAELPQPQLAGMKHAGHRKRSRDEEETITLPVPPSLDAKNLGTAGTKNPVLAQTPIDPRAPLHAHQASAHAGNAPVHAGNATAHGGKVSAEKHGEKAHAPKVRTEADVHVDGVPYAARTPAAEAVGRSPHQPQTQSPQPQPSQPSERTPPEVPAIDASEAITVEPRIPRAQTPASTPRATTTPEAESPRSVMRATAVDRPNPVRSTGPTADGQKDADSPPPLPSKQPDPPVEDDDEVDF